MWQIFVVIVIVYTMQPSPYWRLYSWLCVTELYLMMSDSFSSWDTGAGQGGDNLWLEILYLYHPYTTTWTHCAFYMWTDMWGGGLVPSYQYYVSWKKYISLGVWGITGFLKSNSRQSFVWWGRCPTNTIAPDYWSERSACASTTKWPLN